MKLLGRRFLFLRLSNSVAATASHGKDVAFAESRIRGETIAAEDDVRVVAVHTAGTGYFDCRRIDWQNCVSSQVEVRLCSASACKITQVYGNMFVEWKPKSSAEGCICAKNLIDFVPKILSEVPSLDGDFL